MCLIFSITRSAEYAFHPLLYTAGSMQKVHLYGQPLLVVKIMEGLPLKSPPKYFFMSIKWYGKSGRSSKFSVIGLGGFVIMFPFSLYTIPFISIKFPCFS